MNYLTPYHSLTVWTNHSVPFPRCTTPRHGAEKEECRDCCMALVTPYIRTHFETGEEVIWREVTISHRKKRPLAQKFMCFKESIGQEEHKQAKLPNMRCVCYFIILRLKRATSGKTITRYLNSNPDVHLLLQFFKLLTCCCSDEASARCSLRRKLL